MRSKFVNCLSLLEKCLSKELPAIFTSALALVTFRFPCLQGEYIMDDSFNLKCLQKCVSSRKLYPILQCFPNVIEKICAIADSHSCLFKEALAVTDDRDKDRAAGGDQSDDDRPSKVREGGWHICTMEAFK